MSTEILKENIRGLHDWLREKNPLRSDASTEHVTSIYKAIRDAGVAFGSVGAGVLGAGVVLGVTGLLVHTVGIPLGAATAVASAALPMMGLGGVLGATIFSTTQNFGGRGDDTSSNNTLTERIAERLTRFF